MNVAPNWMPIGVGFALAIISGLALIIWALLYSKAAGGAGMERPYWGTQFYAYSVCIIAVLVFLFSFTSLLGSALDAAQPLRARAGFGPVLTSFEAYKATYDREERLFSRTPTTKPAPSEDELRRRYDALRQDRIDDKKFGLLRSLVSDGLLIYRRHGKHSPILAVCVSLPGDTVRVDMSEHWASRWTAETVDFRRELYDSLSVRFGNAVVMH